MNRQRPEPSRKPDQHESQIRKLDLLLQGQAKQESATATLADRVARLADAIESGKPIKIEITCKCEGAGGGGGDLLTAINEAFAEVKSAVEGIHV